MCLCVHVIKAIYLEIANDLITEGFLTALRREEGSHNISIPTTDLIL